MISSLGFYELEWQIENHLLGWKRIEFLYGQDNDAIRAFQLPAEKGLLEDIYSIFWRFLMSAYIRGYYLLIYIRGRLQSDRLMKGIPKQESPL